MANIDHVQKSFERIAVRWTYVNMNLQPTETVQRISYLVGGQLRCVLNQQPDERVISSPHPSHRCISSWSMLLNEFF